ncbi:MAG: hypothetical protein UZ21_OP11001000879 [Microgenomates bacterium OLB22]|nr:MAG: hypothetical protein UZ21_OP11001000879 [Microgenomates bacterium OLB22]
MSKRTVIDCDNCEKKSLDEWAQLNVKVGESIDVADARTRDDYVTVHLCTSCCEYILGRILVPNKREIGAAELVTQELMAAAKKAAFSAHA